MRLQVTSLPPYRADTTPQLSPAVRRAAERHTRWWGPATGCTIPTLSLTSYVWMTEWQWHAKLLLRNAQHQFSRVQRPTWTLTKCVQFTCLAINTDGRKADSPTHDRTKSTDVRVKTGRVQSYDMNFKSKKLTVSAANFRPIRPPIIDWLSYGVCLCHCWTRRVLLAYLQ